MHHVLSLIAAEAKAPLGQKDVDAALKALDAARVASATPIWLAPKEACDIAFEGDSGAVLEAARKALVARPFDVNVVAVEMRRKKLLVADMDSTMIGQECIDELAAEVGLRDEVAAITERAMRGEIAFQPALRERVALLRNLAVAVIDKVLAERIHVTSGARTLIATMKAAGARTTLVSGGFTAFVKPVAARIGFDDYGANELLVDRGRFSGLAAEPILGAEAKEAALAEISKQLGIELSETLAVGDGANDAGMISKAGLGVAFRGKPKLRAIADAVVDHADLKALLYLQGFSREEFVQAEEQDSYER
jgi:phosphoserine phosphatase